MHPAEHLRLSAGNNLFTGKHLLLCVTGSIAAVETIKLVRDFLRYGAKVTVAMTESARRIVHPEALWFASGRKVITALDGDVQHVTLCGSSEEGVDGVVVAPCTANMISKLACGICDDAVSTILVTALGAGKPIIIAPAMHGAMWKNGIIRDNLDRLVSLGVEVVTPAFDENKVKMADIESIFLATGRKTLGAPLSGRKVTVIGGSSAEPIDSVRVITNMSTGGTAVALVKEAYLRGADVELFMGHCSVQIPKFLQTKRFNAVMDLRKLITGKKFDIVLLPAAISDYTPEKKIDGKISSNNETISLQLKKTEKIIDLLDAEMIIGFKLEVGASEEQLKERARKLLATRKLAAVVANRLEDVTEERSRAFLIDGSGIEIELDGTREVVARKIIEHLTKGLA